MIAVYNSASANFGRNEDFGDRRVNLFITLATAVLGGLVFLVTRQLISSLPFLIPAVAFGVAVVISIGWPTFLRIIERNKQTDEFIRSMKDVGKYFIERDSSLRPFLNEFAPWKEKKRRSGKIKISSFGTGGYLQTVAVLNSLVAASFPLLVILALNIASGSPDGPRTPVDGWEYIVPLLVSAGLLALGSWWIHMDRAKRVYIADEDERAGC